MQENFPAQNAINAMDATNAMVWFGWSTLHGRRKAAMSVFTFGFRHISKKLCSLWISVKEAEYENSRNQQN